MKSCWPASGNNRSGFTPWRLTVYMWAYVNNSPVVRSVRIQYTTFAHTVVLKLYKPYVCYRIIPQNCSRTRIWFFILDFHHKALLKQKQSWKHTKLIEKCFTLEEIIAEQGRACIFETLSITMTELPDFFFLFTDEHPLWTDCNYFSVSEILCNRLPYWIFKDAWQLSEYQPPVTLLPCRA